MQQIFSGRKLNLILGYGKSNYENRLILKNIVKYSDIENNLEEIIKKWLEIYEDNGLLVSNFVNLQRKEEFLSSEYTNLMTAIDSLYLMIIKKEHTKEHFAEIVKKLLLDTNLILNFSEKEIEMIAQKVKNMRRYFVHSNKTQKEEVSSNINLIMDIMTFLVEVIRVRIMLEIGIDKKIIEKYYKNIEKLKNVKNNIVKNINIDDIKEEGKKTMKPLSKNEREYIAQLNAISGTHYRENGYDLENTKDLIEAVQYITAEYIDYYNYWAQLSSILENFDQSLEVFNPAKRMKMVKEHGSGDGLINETINNLSDACDNMYELMDIAEEKCVEIWKTLLLGDNKEAKKHFIGNSYKYNEKFVEEVLDDVIENIYDIGHINVVEEDCNNFAKRVAESIKELKKIKNNKK